MPMNCGDFMKVGSSFFTEVDNSFSAIPCERLIWYVHDKFQGQLKIINLEYCEKSLCAYQLFPLEGLLARPLPCITTAIPFFYVLLHTPLNNN